MIARGEALASAIAEVPPAARDARVDELLRTPPLPRPVARVLSDDPELIDCIPSGTAAVAHALLAAEVGPDDVFVDLGAGLGTVAVLAHLLAGATAVGVDLQPALVAAARARATALGLDRVAFVEGDARTVELPAGTVFYLYAPFTGSALRRVLDRLQALAGTRQIVICCLGFDLQGVAGWLHVVDDDSLFLTIYESTVPGASPRRKRAADVPSLAILARGDRTGDPL